MVDLADPTIGEHVIDPSCGTGGFLIRVYDVVSEKILSSDLSAREKTSRLGALANHCLVGVDWETRAARTCKMNMIIHGDGHAGVYQANALDLDELRRKAAERRRFYPDAPTAADGTFDIVLTNPPFGARDDLPSILQWYELGRVGSQKREVLLLERHIQLLRPGGRLVTVIPEGILSNRNDAHIRRFLLEQCIVKAIIRLPQDAFRMSEGAACTSVLYAVKKDPEDPSLMQQGDIFFARAEYIGVSPSGKPIPQNDLLSIRENYRNFERGEWDGIALRPLDGDRMELVRAERDGSDGLWLEPSVNRTSLLYDRLCYVVRAPRIVDRFSYTYFHPAYQQIAGALDRMPVKVVPLATLCVQGYPVRGQRPGEEALEGIPIFKVRNITGRGIDLESEFAPDNETTRRRCARALIKKGDVLITCTGEGTIGRVEIYPYEEEAIVDGHVTICRLKPGINLDYLVEFLRSESGQIQMLRYVSGSTGQTELLQEPIRALRVPLPPDEVQERIVQGMREARSAVGELRAEAERLNGEGAHQLALARQEMMRILSVAATDDAGSGNGEDASA